jgi:glutamate synthase (NADPH/NADH) large chain
MFISGIVGERFLVRNSGATAVVEGVGDHALEYMTGGIAVILGATGRNLGAGMSGGVAYVHALNRDLVNAQSLGSGELRLEPLDRADLELLRGLLVEHIERTASPIAQTILDGFDAAADEFTKVLPRDFAAVQNVRQEAELAGDDPDGDSVWHKILEVTGG